MDEVASHMGNETTTTDDRATKNGSLLRRLCQFLNFYKMAIGKKRAREMEPKEEKKRKHVKLEGKEGLSDKPVKISINIKKVPKQKAQNRRAQSNLNVQATSTFIY